MTIVNSGHFGTVNEKSVSDFEGVIGASLPRDYVDFLLEHNGGTPENGDGSVFCFFPLRDIECRDHRVVEIDDLKGYPLHCARRDFVREYSDEIEGSESVLPIGTDGNGNFICLSLEENSFGEVSFFDHETLDLDTVAGSFEEFLQNPVL
ncbi:SMI1/KNR4 family protein [Planctomycetota bacterium]